MPDIVALLNEDEYRGDIQSRLKYTDVFDKLNLLGMYKKYSTIFPDLFPESYGGYTLDGILKHYVVVPNTCGSTPCGSTPFEMSPIVFNTVNILMDIISRLMKPLCDVEINIHRDTLRLSMNDTTIIDKILTAAKYVYTQTNIISFKYIIPFLNPRYSMYANREGDVLLRVTQFYNVPDRVVSQSYVTLNDVLKYIESEVTVCQNLLKIYKDHNLDKFSIPDVLSMADDYIVIKQFNKDDKIVRLGGESK